MDFESREIYRRRIASTARHSDLSNTDIARAALALARIDTKPSGERSRSTSTYFTFAIA